MQSEQSLSDPELHRRAAARQRLISKRGFRVHLTVYLAVNALLWVVWGVVFANTDVWFPWPVFPLLGWGIGLGFHAWETFGRRRSFTDEQIDREVERLRS